MSSSWKHRPRRPRSSSNSQGRRQRQRLQDLGYAQRKLLSIPHLRCACGKCGYNDEIVANLVLERCCIENAELGRSHRAEKRVYQCQFGKWHLTSKERWQ